MKIMHVSNNYTPFSGGVVRSIDAFGKQFRSSGHDYKLVTIDFLGSGHDDPDFVVRMPSIISFSWKKNRIAVPLLMRRALDREVRLFRPDIIHVHHPFLLCHAALAVAKQYNIPIVFTYHSMYERYTHYIPFYQPVVRYALSVRRKSFCSAVDHIVAPSRSIKDSLCSFGIETPITILPSPIRDVFFQKGSAQEKRKNSKCVLLVVGRLVKEKNIKYILDIVSNLPRERFLLKIVGYGEQEGDLRRYAYKSLGLGNDQVQFIIKPPEDRLLSLYREADLFLFSSTSDTQGLVLAESMALGTPVLSVDGSGQRDIIVDGYNGYIIASRDEMVEKIKQIAENNDLLVRLQKGAYETVQKYRADHLTRCLEGLYHNLISKQ